MAKAKKTIAKTAKPEIMSGATLDSNLRKIDISNEAFGRLLRSSGRVVRSWISEEYPVPVPVAYLVNLMLKTKTKPEELKAT